MRTIIVFLLLASPTFASGRFRYNNCHSGYCAPVVKKVVAAAPVVYPQTIIQNQNILYPAGADLYSSNNAALVQAESQQIQREFARLADRMTAYQQYSTSQPTVITHIHRYEASTVTQGAAVDANCTEYGHGQTGQQPTFNQTAPGSILSTTCLKCHSGANPKGGFNLDRELSCDDKMLIMAMVMRDDGKQMPPSGKLTKQQTFSILQELAELPTAGQAEQPPQQPPAPPVPQPIPPQDPPSDRPSLQPPKDAPEDNAAPPFSKLTPEQVLSILQAAVKK